MAKPVDVDVPPHDAHDPLDDPDVDASAIENRPLLDMELEKGEDLSAPPPRFVDAFGTAADEGDALGDGLLGMRGQVELFGSELAGHGTASRLAVLLVLEEDDLDGMARRRARLAQAVGDLDGGHGTDLSVVVAAVGHGVDVRAEHEGRERRLASLTPAEDVPRRVDADVEPRLAHPVHGEVPPGSVGLAIGHTRDTSLRSAPEASEPGETLVQAGAVHA